MRSYQFRIGGTEKRLKLVGLEGLEPSTDRL